MNLLSISHHEFSSENFLHISRNRIYTSIKLESYANLRLNFGLYHKTIQSYMTITYPKIVYPQWMEYWQKKIKVQYFVGIFTFMSISKVLKMNYKFEYGEIETFSFWNCICIDFCMFTTIECSSSEKIPSKFETR